MGLRPSGAAGRGVESSADVGRRFHTHPPPAGAPGARLDLGVPIERHCHPTAAALAATAVSGAAVTEVGELPFEGEPTGAATLEGTLLSITFRNEDNGYTVARLEVHGHRLPITVVGPMPGIEPGDSLALSGRWVTH